MEDRAKICEHNGFVEVKTSIWWNSLLLDPTVCFTKQYPWHSPDGIVMSVTRVSAALVIIVDFVIQHCNGAEIWKK